MATLYDHLGRPIRMKALKEELAGPTVTGVRSVMSGHPAQGLTPERLARLMRESEGGDPQRYLELAEEMEEKELHYRSVLGTRKLQVAGLDIQVEAVSDSAEDVGDADFVRDVVNTNILQEALFDILDAVGKGFSVTEILWDCSEKAWVPRALKWRDPRWFQFDRVDGVTPLLRGGNGELLSLAPAKFIHHQHKSKSGLPIRGGLARAVSWAYLFKNFDIKSWVIFAEVYGHPLRLGKYDGAATVQDKETLLRAVRNIGQDHAAIVPDSMAIDFIEAKGAGHIDVYERLAEYLDRQISKLVLGQTGTTDTGSRVGTADAHERVRDDIELSDAGQLSSTLNRDLIRPLVMFNRGERKRYPSLRIRRPDQEDIDSLVNNVVKLVPLGLRVEASVMRDKLGLPDPDKGAEVLTSPMAAFGAPFAGGSPPEVGEKAAAGSGPVRTWGDRGAEPPGMGKEKAAARKEAPPAEGAGTPAGVDLAVDDLSGDWQPLIRPLTDPVLKLAEACADEEQFMDLLPGLIESQGTEELTNHLARAIFAAKLAGMAVREPSSARKRR